MINNAISKCGINSFVHYNMYLRVVEAKTTHT